MTLRGLVLAVLAAQILACASNYEDPRQYDAGPLPDGGITAPMTNGVALTGAPERRFRNVAFADLDHDGLDDIILANEGSSGDADTPAHGSSIVIVYGRRERLGSTLDLEMDPVEIIVSPTPSIRIHLAPGDYDGDGTDDLALAVLPFTGARNTFHILYGSDTRITGMRRIRDVGAEFSQPAEVGDGWANPIANAGDLDGNGIDDLFVSAPTRNRSEVSVLLGRATQWSGAGRFTADLTFVGERGRVCFTRAGDLDGDGHDDALIGEVRSVRELRFEGLRLAVFYGPIDRASVSIAAAPAHVVTLGVDLGGVLGGFDANGDGLSDFVVPGDFAATDLGGVVHLFLGSRTRLFGVVGPALSAVTLEGASDYARAGVAVSAGDADGDGRDDLLVGSPGSGAPGRVDRMYGMPRSISLVSADATWIGPERVVDGTPLRDRLGEALAQDGDFDGDGRADALLGAPTTYGDPGGNVVYFVYGGR